uniref:Uncharacterized protein n=1 Tax=Anguilla anguilla TaxID=7936 RepID=A0A0E9WST4_ANGAN
MMTKLGKQHKSGRFAWKMNKRMSFNLFSCMSSCIQHTSHICCGFLCSYTFWSTLW